MAQSFLYLLELVVDDLLITRPNCCAPDEYPTCCEVNFRTSVFVSICDREYGNCVDLSAPKCCKCCLFALDSPISDKDRLLINVYKKKNDLCKFLIGTTDLPIKTLFDKVTESFNVENPNWLEKLERQQANLPDMNEPSKNTVIDNDVDDCDWGRPEQWCMTSELTKRLLPLFNKKGQQTGNLVMVLRLVCNGPAIVSSFPYTAFCPQKNKDGTNVFPCPIPPPGGPAVCAMGETCKNKEKKPIIPQRYFSTNAEKGCPYEQCEDYCDRECPTVKPKSKSKCPGPSLRPQSACCPQSAPRPPPPCCRPQQQSSCGRPQSSSNCCRPKTPPSCTCTPVEYPQDNKPKSANPPYEEKPPVNSCTCDECMDECEAAKARALRKLRYLMQKYSNCS